MNHPLDWYMEDGTRVPSPKTPEESIAALERGARPTESYIAAVELAASMLGGGHDDGIEALRRHAIPDDYFEG